MSESVEQSGSADLLAVTERIEQLVQQFYSCLSGDIERAGCAIDEALALAAPLGDHPLHARALCAAAHLDRHRSNSASAIEKLERARDISSRIGDLARQGFAIGLIGTVHKSLGDSRTALAHQLQALELYERSGDLTEKGGVLNDIGNAYKTMGDFTNALEYHLQSLDIAIETGNRRGEAGALNNIGNIYYELADFPVAVDYYLRSLEIKEELGDPVGLGNSYGNLGLVYASLGDHDQSVEYHSRSLHCFRGCGDREGETNSLGNLATLWCTRGNTELALQFASQSVALAREIGDREAESDSLRTIGNARHLEGDYSGAVQTLREALEIAIEIAARPLEQKIHHSLAGALQMLGDPAGAFGHLQQMYRIREEIASANARRMIVGRAMLYDVESARKEAEIERLKNVELAEAFRELEAAQMRLVHAEKMAYIGHLTAGVTDQARQPLASIGRALGPLSAAARRILDPVRRCIEGEAAGGEALPAPEEIGPTLEMILGELAQIEEEAARTAAIVEGLRSFTRLDEGDLKPASLHEGISALLTLVRNRCRGRISISFAAGMIPPVECYPGLVNQAVLAIVSEGIDIIESLGGRGSITIATDSIGPSVTMTIISRSEPADTGGDRDVVEPGDPADSLAVTVAREILEKHGGTVVVRRSRSGDLETRLTLPIRQARRRSSAASGGRTT